MGKAISRARSADDDRKSGRIYSVEERVRQRCVPSCEWLGACLWGASKSTVAFPIQGELAESRDPCRRFAKLFSTGLFSKVPALSQQLTAQQVVYTCNNILNCYIPLLLAGNPLNLLNTVTRANFQYVNPSGSRNRLPKWRSTLFVNPSNLIFF